MAVVFVHFTETLFVLALELLLDRIVTFATPLFHAPDNVLPFVHMFSKWFAVAALTQFAIGSLARFAVLTYWEIRRVGKDGPR